MTATPLHRTVRPALRLTARGRRALAALLLAPVALGLGAGLAQLPAAFAGDPATAAAGEREMFEMRSVAAGETLWQIAESIAGDRDVRDVVHEIMRLNNLDTAALQAGQRLALPNLD